MLSLYHKKLGQVEHCISDMGFKLGWSYIVLGVFNWTSFAEGCQLDLY